MKKQNDKDIYYDEDREVRKEKIGVIILAGAVLASWVIYLKVMLF